METQVSILLSKLTLGFGDFKNGFLEILYNNKKENISYPQTNPISLIFPPKFIKDKQLITINAKKKIGNKVKNVAHGELVLYKNNFIEGKGVVEKYITMVQLDSKVDTIKINKDNMGTIFVKVSLEEPYEEWIKKFPNKSRFSSSNSKYKKTLENKTINTYRKINFDDNLSNLTITKIDKNNEDLKNVNLEQFISINEIKKIKNLFDNSYQNILPHDFPNLKKLNYNLYNHYQELDTTYKKMLENINKENNDTKIRARKTWEKYKENKKKLFIKRKEFKLKRLKLKDENNTTKDESKKLINSINTLNNYQKKIYKQILGEKEEDEDIKIIEEKKKDIKIMTEILNKLNSLGYNIEDEMNGEEKTILNGILNKNNSNEEKIENNEMIKEEKKMNEENIENNYNKEENYKNNEDDENLSEKIVTLIERDVNDLYSRKLIQKMKIDQINSITYSFSNEQKQKIIGLKIENNNLMCSNGQTFAVWLISNFNS